MLVGLVREEDVREGFTSTIVGSERIRDFEKQHSRGIYNSQTLDGNYVLGEDELRVCAWVEETFSVSSRSKG